MNGIKACQAHELPLQPEHLPPCQVSAAPACLRPLCEHQHRQVCAVSDHVFPHQLLGVMAAVCCHTSLPLPHKLLYAYRRRRTQVITRMSDRLQPTVH